MTPEQAAFLQTHRVAHLATANGAGQPHVVPVCFALLGGAIYTPLDRKPKRVPVERLRRVRDLAANPAVCLTVDDYDEDWRRLHWLQVRGTARVVPPGEEQRAAIGALQARYAQYREMALEELPVIRIEPERVIDWRWPVQED
ncbi:MAG TPA: TIGR03668 family PPOX class F420-dependent oxidoreductase [Dehalococcoidia bacterium]